MCSQYNESHFQVSPIQFIFASQNDYFWKWECLVLRNGLFLGGYGVEIFNSILL